MHGFEHFSTTLSVSPHKDFGMIREFGQALALRYRINFLAEDFKKQNGFARSCELARTYDLYRQSYCGCRFSKVSKDI
jgi:predicted adenine nucleotide alpha hydrolase (AANH) superfamily ATPase